MEDRFDRPEIRNDLARIAAANLASWLVHHAISPLRFRELVGTGPLNTVDHERLEYAAPRSFFGGLQSTFLLDSIPFYRIDAPVGESLFVSGGVCADATPLTSSAATIRIAHRPMINSFSWCSTANS